jgi:hypothetical protein
MPKQFFTVWRDGGGSSTYKHDTQEQAEAEALRLAHQVPGAEFHVMKPVATYSVGTKIERYDEPPIVKGAKSYRVRFKTTLRGTPKYVVDDGKIDTYTSFLVANTETANMIDRWLAKKVPVAAQAVDGVITGACILEDEVTLEPPADYPNYVGSNGGERYDVMIRNTRFTFPCYTCVRDVGGGLYSFKASKDIADAIDYWLANKYHVVARVSGETIIGAFIDPPF